MIELYFRQNGYLRKGRYLDIKVTFYYIQIPLRSHVF